MLRYLLDTNVLVRMLRQRPDYLLRRFNAEARQLSTSTIVLYELHHGAAKSAKPAEGRRVIDDMVARLTILPFDAEAAEEAGDVRAELERRGQVIGGNDMQIAGHARSQNLIVVTSDLADFGRIEGLRCEDWPADA